MAKSRIRRRVLGRKAQLGLFGGLSALLLAITVVLAAQVFLRMSDYMTARQDNMAWTVSQLEVEQLKLLGAIRDLDPGATMSAGPVRRWFDVVQSHRQTIADAPAYSNLVRDARVARAMAEMGALLQDLAPLMGGSDEALIAAQDQVVALTRALSGPIGVITSRGVLAYAESQTNERRALADKLMQTTLLSVLLLIALLSLTILLWQLYRLYRGRALENRTTLNQLETILNTSQDAVLVVGIDGGIIDTNRAANAMFFKGASPPEDLGIEQVLYRKEEDSQLRAVSGQMLLNSCKDGPNLCANVVAQTAVGQRIPVELSNDRATRGGRTVVICFIRNIARRMADHAEVLAARDTALSGEKAKARFLGMISHEMRTPLNGLLGTLDLLQDTDLDRDQTRFANIMQSSGQALLTQINDALDVTQAAQGGLTLSPERFDLDQLVRDLVRAQSLQADARGNRLHHIAPPMPLGHVTGDPNRVHQVLLNLISNANKFTDHGQITIEVCRIGPKGEDEMVEFQITDTGIGIAAQDHAAVFEDFVRLEPAHGRSVEGSGIGLGIVRHLVQLMGGEIGLDSTPEEGSLFWVHLPLPRAAQQVKGTKVSATGQIPPMDILIVEDNEINRTVLSEMLTADGHRICQAPNGAEGVARAEARRFDLILMDITMPVMDGLQAAALIREGGGASARARILALSAHVTPEMEQCQDVDGVLRKPLRRKTLKAALHGTTDPVAPGVAAAGSGVIDPTHLSHLRHTLSKGGMTNLMDGFLSEGTALMDDLPHDPADARADLPTRLHQFAGLAATLGALPLQSALGQAQTALEAGKDKASRRALRQLPQIWQDTLRALSDQRDAA